MKKNKLSTANDKIYTPIETAKDIISKFNLFGTVLDPFKGNGAFYDNLPETVEKDWCEIDLGRDFFDYNKKVDWIISNPPYSIFGSVITIVKTFAAVFSVKKPYKFLVCF